MTQAREPSASQVPDRNVIRAELERTRTEYLELLGSLSPEDWRHASANTGWRVGQLMWHVAWAAGYAPQAVEACRKGKGRNPPAWLMHPANLLITRLGSRNATPASVGEKFDRAHAALLPCLEGVKDDEWEKGVMSFGQYSTIATAFRRYTDHWQEHQAEILKGLGRT